MADVRGRLVAAVERAKKHYEAARGSAGMAEEARKRKGQRIQSSAEQRARSKASEVYREVYTAERALKEFDEGGQAKDSVLTFSAFIAALLAWYDAQQDVERNQASGYRLDQYRPKPKAF